MAIREILLSARHFSIAFNIIFCYVYVSVIINLS